MIHVGTLAAAGANRHSLRFWLPRCHTWLIVFAASEPPLVLSGNRHHLFDGELKGPETAEGLHLFRQAQQDQQLIEVLAQLQQHRLWLRISVPSVYLW